MVVIVVCYDLTQPPNIQLQQLSYWLDFLQSALPPSTSASKSKWKVIIVGTKLDLCTSPPVQRDTFVRSWQAKWADIPIYDTHFQVSSWLGEGVRVLLHAIEDTFSSIFTRHAIRIPKSYKTLLHSLQSIPEQQSVQSISDLCSSYSHGLPQLQFTLAIKYLHTIGRVVVLKGDRVCTAPKLITTIAAKFISPDDVRMKLATSEGVEILEEDQVGAVLTISDTHRFVFRITFTSMLILWLRLNLELKLLEYVGISFRLTGKKNLLLFPSLSSRASMFYILPVNHTHLNYSSYILLFS